MDDPSFAYIEALDEETLEDEINPQTSQEVLLESAICDQCGKGFTNIYTLSAHKKQVHEGIKEFKCNICYAAFATKYKLKRHHAGVHSEDRNFTCEFCSGKFKTRDMLKKHERSHFQGIQHECTICNEVFKFKSGYDYHYQLKHQQRREPDAPVPKVQYMCPECNKVFNTQKALERHEENHKVKENELQCTEPNCYKMFSCLKDQQRHIKLIHSNVVYSCSYCKKQYKSKSNFEIHIASHERTNEMEDYEYVTEPSDVIIEEVYENDEENLIENDENSSSGDEKEVNIEDLLKNIDSDMVSIVKIETEVLQEPEEPVEEPEILEETEDPIIAMEPPEGMEFAIETDEDYDEGMDFFETIIAEDLEPPPLSDDELMSQKKTSPGFKVSRPKCGEAMSICEECGAFFKNNSHLKRHVMRKHRKDEYKMECDVCGQKFLLSYDLKRHMSKHSNVRDFECATCNQKFKTEISLKNHVKVVHEEKSENSRKFMCQQCDRSYFHRRHLDYHMRKHTGDQRFRCELCIPEKTFHYSDAIKWHKIRHHGEAAPFNCSICRKKFIHEKSLHSHEKEHQPDSGSLSVSCPECGKKVSEKRHLKRHMRTHTSKEFHCPCGESFKERHQLTKHKQICSGENNDEQFVITTLA